MMPLDILLTLARISIVAAVAFLIGRALLTRRPDAVPGVSVTALVCGCLLLALTGAEWPALWQSTLPAPRPEAAIASPSTMPVSQSEEATQPAGVSLTAVLESVRNMARTAPARESNNFWRWVCWLAGALAVIAIGRVLLGLLATWQFHKASRVEADSRLIELCETLSIESASEKQIEFRVSKRIHAPCVSALSNRVVFLPPDWRELPDDALAAAIAHELAHLVRRDARWRLLAQLATALQFFHPLAHGLLRQLIFGQEIAADREAASWLGPQRYVSGISTLALRLDAAAVSRPPKGIGMSHSSSFLIRRIKMLRKGLPERTGSGRSLFGLLNVICVVAVTAVSATWSVSAEEPVRVAARTKTSKANQPSAALKPWEILPGRTGYWSFNVARISKHSVAGQWLTQADTLFLNPGWAMVARQDGSSREELGVALKHFDRLAGSVWMKISARPPEAGGKEKHQMNIVSGEFVLHFAEDVDWKAVEHSLSEEKFDAILKNHGRKVLIQKQIDEMIKADVLSAFFSHQTSPRRMVMKPEKTEKPEGTPPVLTSLWKDHEGELATLVIQLPPMSGPIESDLDRKVDELHKAAKFHIIAIDSSKTPANVRLRIGLSPRGDTTPTGLTKLFEESIESLLKEAQEDAKFTPQNAMVSLLTYLDEAKPTYRKSSNPAHPGAVMIEIDVPAMTLFRMYGG